MEAVKSICACLLTLASFQVSDRLVLATPEPLEASLKEELDKAGIAQAKETLASIGFIEFQVGERTYLLDPKLAQQRTFEMLPKMWAALGKQTSAVFSPQEDEALQMLMQAAFGDRYEGTSEASYAVGGAATLILGTGERRLVLNRTGPTSPECRAQLQAQPLASRDLKLSRAPALTLADVMPTQQASIHLHMLGRPEYRQFVWADDFRNIGEFLSKRLGQLRAAAMAGVEQLFGGLSSDSFVSELMRLEKGSTFSSIPQGLRRSIEHMIADDFTRYGFASEDDARKFLANARLEDFTRGVEIKAARAKGGFTSVVINP